jgi:hypothetical protein
MPDIIGAIERRNPLPPGVYWVDVIGEVPTFGGPDNSKLEAFAGWLRRNASNIQVLRTVSKPAEIDALRGVMNPAQDWYLFKVAAPVQWEGPGLPTIADENTEKDDTAQRPPPADPSWELPDLPDVTEHVSKGALTGFGTVFGLAAGAWILNKLLRKGK